MHFCGLHKCIHFWCMPPPRKTIAFPYVLRNASPIKFALPIEIAQPETQKKHRKSCKSMSFRGCVFRGVFFQASFFDVEGEKTRNKKLMTIFFNTVFLIRLSKIITPPSHDGLASGKTLTYVVASRQRLRRNEFDAIA